MQVVERRREQAAEVVEPRLEPAAKRSQGVRRAQPSRWTYSELPISSVIEACLPIMEHFASERLSVSPKF